MRYNQRNLTPEEEISLGSRIQSGLQAAASLTQRDLDPDERQQNERIRNDGVAAGDELATSNLRLAESRVMRFAGSQRDTEEMRSDAFEALLRAARRFDPAFGLKFSTYATTQIEWAVQNGIDTGGLVREPSNVAKARRAQNRMMILNPKAVRPASRPQLRMASLDGSVFEATSDEPCHAERNADRSEVTSILEMLTARQVEVITLMYGLAPNDERPKSMSEVAQMLGVSVQTISEIHKAALNRARNRLALAA